MPSEFVHELANARILFETLAAEKGVPGAIVEKDYWVMHCLWGLQQNGLSFEMKGGTSLSKGWNCIDRFSEDIDIRFGAPPTLNVKGVKPAQIMARFGYFDALASEIRIPGVAVVRNKAYDDEKAQNGGISLRYDSHFAVIPGLKPEVLLEVGFTQTAPNEPRDFTSWALERVMRSRIDVIDNRAMAIRCFNPEYTFIDKLQAVCRRFRQYRDRKNPDKDRPRQFLRHYYDLFKLLELDRVRQFVGKPEYEAYTREKIRGQDAVEFQAKTAFTLSDKAAYEEFEKDFESLGALMLGPAPTFEEMIRRLRKHAPDF